MALIEEVAGVGDVGELYGQLAGRLERMVRLDVRAPDAVIEDACQFAWSRLVRHRHRVQRETVLTWLVRTAVHEALKLVRRDLRDLPLDAVAEQASPASPQEFVERRFCFRGERRQLAPVRDERVGGEHSGAASIGEDHQSRAAGTRRSNGYLTSSELSDGLTRT